MPALTPTTTQYDAFEAMFRYFNTTLFASTLPACMLSFSRKTKTLGFFAPARWTEAKGGKRAAKAHEISLNPDMLASRSPRDVASTLVHEMAHLWQAAAGTPSRSGYHNEEWAKKMEAIGLPASDTGAPGGKRVGQCMSHYMEEGGRFDVAFRAMPKALALPFLSSAPATAASKAKNASKTKYECEGCGAAAWAKPGASLLCGECEDESGTPLAFEVAS